MEKGPLQRETLRVHDRFPNSIYITARQSVSPYRVCVVAGSSPCLLGTDTVSHCRGLPTSTADGKLDTPYRIAGGSPSFGMYAHRPQSDVIQTSFVQSR